MGLSVLTNLSPVEIDIPRTGSFEPQIVKKPQRRLIGVDEMVVPDAGARPRRIEPVPLEKSSPHVTPYIGTR
ncbi:hypothetical protein ACFXDH_43705 [Streptomyces sp. NPDC059467]|uniref:hypothetical protein n=1 Tax=Streptomyces sp. NPDC059467 TaxID=3346844 RepID=UPI00367699B4